MARPQLRFRRLCGSDAGRCVAALVAGDATTALRQAERIPPSALPGLTSVLQAQIHGRLGDPAAQQEALDRYTSGYNDRFLSSYLLPWASASSLILLGDVETAMGTLRVGWRNRDANQMYDRPAAAQSYLYVGNMLWEAGQNRHATDAYLMSSDIHPDPAALSAGGRLALEHGDTDGAVQLFVAGLRADPPTPAAVAEIATALLRLGGKELLSEPMRELARRHPDWNLEELLEAR